MIKFDNTDHFALKDTFLCGQCFRWNENSDGSFEGIAGKSPARIFVKDRAVFVDSPNENESFWKYYLGLEEDYNAVQTSLKNGDELLLKAAEMGRGIRILRQDLWETIISFIISANNNIPRIKKIIAKFSQLYGEKIDFKGKAFYGFPTSETIAKIELSDLSEIKAGFRDKYILDAAKKVESGEVDLEKIIKMNDTDAKAELMKIKGVGNKVADCVLLFSLGRYSTFPLDVWTKRILNEKYGANEKSMPIFVREHFGSYAGIAQQYLFNYFAVLKEN